MASVSASGSISPVTTPPTRCAPPPGRRVVLPCQGEEAEQRTSPARHGASRLVAERLVALEDVELEGIDIDAAALHRALELLVREEGLGGLGRIEIVGDRDEIVAVGRPQHLTRAIARLCDDGFVDREQDPNDRRSVIASLTGKGLRKLRAAQVTHHKCAREVFFAGMQGDDIERLATIYEHAMPGVLDEPTWPPPGRSS